MAKQTINVGTTANDRKGDSLRAAFQKVNANFTELYTALGLNDPTLNLGAFEFTGSVISTTDSTAITIDQATTVTSDLTVGGDILPSVNNGGNIGSPSRQWRSLYVSTGTIYINNIPISLDNNNKLTLDGEPISATIDYASIPDAPKDLSDLTDNANLLTALTGVNSIEFWDSSVQTTAYRYAAQDTAPTMTTGALWFNTTDGRLYVNYNNIWVDASPTEIDPSAIRFNEQNQIELPDGGDIVDSLGNSVLGGSSDRLVNGDKSVILGTDGKLTLPAGTTFEYINTPLTGYGDGLARLDFSLVTDGVVTEWMAASPNPAGSGYSVGNTFTFNDDFLGIPGASLTITVLEIGPGGSIVELGFTPSPLYPADIYRDSPINIQVGAESNRWTFKSDGSLTFPDGYLTIQDSQGGVAIQAAAEKPIALYSSGAGPSGSAIAWFDNFLAPTKLAVVVANNPLYVGEGDAGIITGSALGEGITNIWNFGADGNLIIPGDIRSEGNINIDINLADSTLRRWTFGEDGDLRFPDGTVQTTAWVDGGSSIVNTTSLSVNDFTTGTYDNKGSVEVTYTPYTGAESGFNFSAEFQSPLDGTKGVTVGAVSTPLIHNDNGINIEINLADSTKRIWSFQEDGDLTVPGSIQNGNSKLEFNTGGDTNLTLTVGDTSWQIDSTGFLNAPNQRFIRFYDGQGAVNGAIGGDNLDHVVFVAGENKGIKVFTDDGTNLWRFGADGSLTLPGDIHGAPLLSAGPTPSQIGRIVNITPADDASDKAFRFSIDQLGETFSRAYLQLPTAEVDKQVAAVFPHSNGKAGYIFTQGTNATDDGMNDAFNIFYNSGDIKLTAMTSLGVLRTWKFGDDGNLTLPGDIRSEQAINIDINLADSTLRRWQFGENGDLTLPVDGDIKDSTGTSVLGTTLYLLEAYASETYTLPGSFTEDPCRYSVVSNAVNVPSAWFNTSTYTFTPLKAGYWEITAAYDVYRNTEASMAIKKNNSIVAAAGSFGAVAQQITKIIYFNGSTDSANIINVGGAALSRDQYDSRSWFQARWVGA